MLTHIAERANGNLIVGDSTGALREIPLSASVHVQCREDVRRALSDVDEVVWTRLRLGAVTLEVAHAGGHWFVITPR